MCPKIPYLASCLPQAHGGCPKAPPPTQTLWRTVSPKQAAFGEKSRHHSEFAIETKVRQTGKNVDLQAIYEIVLRTAWYCLKPGGRFVMLVLRGLQMMRILRKLSGRYRLLSIDVVRTTNNM